MFSEGRVKQKERNMISWPILPGYPKATWRKEKKKYFCSGGWLAWVAWVGVSWRDAVNLFSKQKSRSVWPGEEEEDGCSVWRRPGEENFGRFVLFPLSSHWPKMLFRCRRRERGKRREAHPRGKLIWLKGRLPPFSLSAPMLFRHFYPSDDICLCTLAIGP